MWNPRTPFERAMTLAAVSGFKTMMGPALAATSRRSPGWQMLAVGLMGEMVLDKLPILPSRRSLPLLLPRAFAGYWAAKQSLEADGSDDASAAWMGAVVAAGVAALAPTARGLTGTVTDAPDFLVGLAEDALALWIGSAAVGLSRDQLYEAAQQAVAELGDQVEPIRDQVRERLAPAG